MIGLVLGADELVGLHELVVGVDGAVVHAQAVGLGVAVDVVGAGGGALVRVLDDGDGALRADHVLHEERHLAHHRAPARLVPAHGAVLEGDLELAVVVHARLQLLGEPRADRGDAHWPGARHLAHDIDVVDAAVHDGAHRVHQVLVPVPGGAVALLVQVHPHHERLAEGAGDLDEPRPGRVDAQDVPDHQLQVARARRVDDRLGLFHGGGQGLLAEDVAAGLDRRPGERAVRLGIGVDAHHVGPGDPERLVVVAELGQAAQLRAERAARRRATTDEADDLELRHPVVGAGVARAHVAAAGHEHAKGTVHGSTPWREPETSNGQPPNTTRARDRPASPP